LDLVGLDGEQDHVRVVVRGSQTHAVALMASGGVVVIDVPVRDGGQVPLAGGSGRCTRGAPSRSTQHPEVDVREEAYAVDMS
jgi:hypothetical protein